MQRLSYGGTVEHKSMSEALSRSLERIELVTGEIDAALKAIRECPAVCTDCTVLIAPPSAAPRRMKCPIVSQDCAYGSRIARDLTSHLVGVMRGICVPVRHLDNFGKRQDTAAVKAAHFWHARGFLVLTGIPGVGKSFAAAWAVLQYLKGKVSNWIDRATWESAENAAKSVMWATAKEICDDKAVYTRACGEALLVLDDFGKEEDTRTGLAAVRNVISKRYDAKLPTIITTELTVLEIESRYGRHISERLSEDAGRGGNFYDCKGESLRLVDEKVPQ